MTKPGCQCWEWGDVDFAGIGYCNQMMGWRLDHANPNVPKYDCQWNEDHKFCPYCGQKAEEVKQEEG